ncbi:MAG: hypothetical protein A2Y62_17085 [Candidatus Fischerbacteria bacterium RBG_13_37_8]|uniref:Mce/MlaD domain-containing protein n=1 Tax=Candidatus Fischerbacteria bacterium RBG_13_37_8 TaxID=1817863 RepID=A0A1F5VFX2_9BACT|nr:MAG: hypothetical protein A2Y62_17085 [Candidatus Fischerbacteria bacterium RBG_13_37_8]
MRKDKKLSWKDIKVGIMLFLAIFLLAATILLIGKEVPLFSRKYTLITYLTNVNGIKTASLVMLAGVEVGLVDDVYFRHDLKKVAVTMKISDKYKPWIRTDSVANVKTMGALGDKYIDITIGSPGLEEIEDNGLIKGSTGAEIDELITQATDAITNINTAASSLDVIAADIRDGKGTIGQLIINDKLHKELLSLASKINDGNGSIAKLVNDQNIYEDIKNVSSTFSDIATNLKEGNKGIGRLIVDDTFSKNLTESSNEIAALIKNLHEGKGTLGKIMTDEKLYNNIATLTQAFVPVAEDIAKGRGTIGKLAQDKTLYENSNRFIQEARLLLTDIRENPKKYLHIKLSLF